MKRANEKAMELARADLVLTWQDIDRIIQLWMAVLDEQDGTKEELYTKIAELFNKERYGK